MSTSPLTFFLRILAILIVVTLCLPQAATAQSERQMLISLPSLSDPGFLPNTFIVYGRATDAEAAGITGNVPYNLLICLCRIRNVFEFGGTLELVTTDSNLRKHDVVISEIMWGTDAGKVATKPIHNGLKLYNPYINTHITPALYLLFTPFEVILTETLLHL